MSNTITVKMATWNFRQTQDAIYFANQQRKATIIVQATGGWNDTLAKAAIDVAKKLYAGRNVELKANGKKVRVKKNDTVESIRKNIGL